MDPKRFTRRLIALGAAMFLCALVFVITLFDAQIVNGDDYLAQSIRTNAKTETVKASRGILTDRNGKVRMMCLGHVLLEEHQPHGVGNHACIITEPNDELMGGVRKLLEDLHFVGYSNFDVKYDERDGSFKFFDFNTRQGRSNYYVTNSGFNVAKYVVDEYVFNRPFEPEFVTAQDEALWMVVPMGVVDKYVKDPELRAKVHRLDKEGKGADPSFMKGDFVFNRWLRMWHTKLRHFKLFKTYYK